ncbi:MAG: DUF3794 domain-containing protein [Oscillospiraceae bacterium]|nr:DUF3794 domain-containing protein [Oscillospiraceae bacterium]
MSDKILWDVLDTTTAFLDTVFELPLEQEMLLADYDMPVFKIISSTVKHTITQKYINGNRLVIEGFFRLEVFYQSAVPSRLTSVSKKIPFRKQIELTESVQNPYFAVIEGESQYINTRAVNSNRIESRGMYQFTVKAFTARQHRIATAINSTTACSETEEVNYFSLCGRGIRQFSLEDEINFGHTADKIIHISAVPSSVNIRMYPDRVNVKGDIETEIIYSTDDTGEIHRLTKTFSCNQMVDIPGAGENDTAFAEISVMGVTVTSDNEQNKIRCMVTAQADTRVFRQNSVIALSDAFSRQYQYSSNRRKVSYDSRIIPVCGKIAVSTEDTAGRGYEGIYCTAMVTSPMLVENNGKTELKTAVTFSAIVKNSREEYECLTKTEEVTIEIGKDIPYDIRCFATVNPGRCYMQVSGDVLKAKTEISVEGFILCRKSTDALIEFDEKTDNPDTTREEALVIYYGKRGEKLFDIAKRYKSDIQMIMDENALEGKILGDDSVLIIQSFGQ